MYWRILGQLLRASRGRLAVALIALASGAAVTTALVNLNFDAERKLRAEFRTLGANIVILPASVPHSMWESSDRIPDPNKSTFHPVTDVSATALMPEGVLQQIAEMPNSRRMIFAPYLYVVANASVDGRSQRAVVDGTWLDQSAELAPWWKIEGNSIGQRNDVEHCLVGRGVAVALGLTPGSKFDLEYSDHSISLRVAGIIDSGGPEDSQIIANIPVVQQLTGLGHRIGLVRISVAGTPEQIQQAVASLSGALQFSEVRPIPQFALAEEQLLARLRGLILFMVALILVLTALCVFASMAALAMERRRDVGLMKAIGAPMARVMSIFLTEAGALGLVGGLIGYGAGIFLSRWIGQTAFHVAINARLEVLPLVVALMVGVSLAGAFPLRLLGRVRPAVILRGE